MQEGRILVAMLAFLFFPSFYFFPHISLLHNENVPK